MCSTFLVKKFSAKLLPQNQNRTVSAETLRCKSLWKAVMPEVTKSHA